MSNSFSNDKCSEMWRILLKKALLSYYLQNIHEVAQLFQVLKHAQYLIFQYEWEDRMSLHHKCIDFKQQSLC